MELILTASYFAFPLLVVDHSGDVLSGITTVVFKESIASTRVLHFQFRRARVVPAVAHFRNVVEILAAVTL
jgi:hypothetical protein